MIEIYIASVRSFNVPDNLCRLIKPLVSNQLFLRLIKALKIMTGVFTDDLYVLEKNVKIS